MTKREWDENNNELGNAPIQIRTTPEFRSRVMATAERNFDGNVSTLIRHALNLYFDSLESEGLQKEHAA